MLQVFSKSLAIIVLSLLLFVVLGGISQNKRWEIATIDILGTQAVDKNEIALFMREKLQGNYFFVYARDNSVIFPRREIEVGLLERFPRLKNVSISRRTFSHIVLEATERKPYMLWCGEEIEQEAQTQAGCWFVDDTGFVFTRAPIFSEGVYREIYSPLLKIREEVPLQATIPSDRFLFTREFNERIERELGSTSHIFIKPEGEYGIVMRESALYPVLADAEVRFKDGQSAEHLIKNLLAAIPVQFPVDSIPQKKLFYIDLRFGNKVFFGFEEGAE